MGRMSENKSKGRRTGWMGIAQLRGVLAVVPLSVAGVDFLPVWADERLLPAHAAVRKAAFDVHGRSGGRGLVRRVEPLPVVLQGLVPVAGLAVLEGDAPLVEVVGGPGVRTGVGRGWLIGVCSRVSGIGGV